MKGVCELVRLEDVERLYGLTLALAARGIESRVLGAWRDMPAGGGRLVVRQRDAVYARWVIAAEGMDPWPDAATAEIGRQAASQA